MRKLFERKIFFLLEDPYHNCKSEPLHHHLKGLRSARVTENIRLIFAVCEEAKEYVPLPIIERCKTLGGKAIIFITLGTHSEVYK
ncbi:MAG: hypothetical protein HYZ34_02795 [Ignavibacteriae bacterium]|nr:hypothetical protein [Ignavibacteriota bacterium]